MIPDVCEVEVDFRVLPGITTQQMFNALGRYASKLGYRIEFPADYTNWQKTHQIHQKRPIDIQLSILTDAPGNISDSKSDFCQLMARAFEDIYRVKSIYFFAPSSSDATHLRKHGIENVVLFGAAGSNSHGANESVEIDQLILGCKLYVLTAYRFLKTP